MANFVVLVDPDPLRRVEFVRRVEGVIAPVDGLRVDQCSSGRFAAIWAAMPGTPVDTAVEPGGAAVIWGDAIGDAGSTHLTAAGLLGRRETAPAGIGLSFDGLYAAVACRPTHEVMISADRLGLFPVYYWAAAEILLAASSPELFRHHPLFRPVFNPAGLVGMLLVMHATGGHTLWKDVRRLAAGHALRWRPGRPPQEIQQYRLRVESRYAHLPFAEQSQLLFSALDQAIARHTGARRSHTLLLSGGRDSRLIAGLLQRRGIPVEAVTLGARTDFDMRYAVATARALGFPHRRVDIVPTLYPVCADLQTRWEHGTNGFATIHAWQMYRHLRVPPNAVISGHLSDAVVGGAHMSWACSPATGTPSFRTFFQRINAQGLQPEVLQRLLRPQVFGDLVRETIGGLRDVYEGYTDEERFRAWCFDLYHRQRFHVGGDAWRLTFGAWPVLPALDRQVLETAAALSADTLWERRAQAAILVRFFPRLARIPFAHRAFHVDLMRTPRPAQAALRVQEQLFNGRRLWARTTGRRLLPFYNARIYDINGPGWQAVRREAEPHRPRAYAFLEKAVLDELLPPPPAPISSPHPIIDSSGVKTLLGFILWCRDQG